MTLPSVTDLKQQAKRLRSALASKGQTVSHSETLEMIASQHGYRDWNTCCAAAGNGPMQPFAVGDRVTGTYLQQPFEGVVTGLSSLPNKSGYRATVQFDKPVDVVTFESFSAWRSRVVCLIAGDGVALKKTSNGEPYMRLRQAS
ncbi:hypothetical protein E1180_06650 [Roseibium denhamense]|uniref:Glyoxalase-related protein domain-containing protein n=1 Tax=Roseibium denhamense TaxID=76305 RepID=A0ABY1P3S9_9HYPH|nr:glyoxalase superfamily protein [Roseibium denhamense]MTI05191.1 hypothetical protein [Roseibium denhamense]SMP25822.1 hypothetical protein SAMN06265374_2613 [Roseibium denhamense]